MKYTKHLREQIVKLVAKEKCPSVEEICATLRCENWKAELVLKEVKARRASLAKSLGVSLPGQHRTDKEGFIYLVKNPAFDGWIKCGMTVNCSDRLKAYNISDPTGSFVFIKSKRVEDRRKAERRLLSELKKISPLQNGEWFRIDERACLEAFDNVS